MRLLQMRLLRTIFREIEYESNVGTKLATITSRKLGR
jgi:hypothetical protein